MEPLDYRDDRLFIDGVCLEEIATAHATPCYVYSRALLERNWLAFDRAFGHCAHLICFAVKANSNLAVLDVLARLGSGFDIVSGGELERVLAAGGRAERIVFSGVGKSEEEMERALGARIHCFNVESKQELEALAAIAARSGVRAPVSIRVNPDVDAKTHPYIATGLKQNKFGVAIDEALGLYREAATLSHLAVVGVDCHIGSQLTSLAPFIDALERVLALVDALAAEGIGLTHLNLGGGIGIRYRDETPPTPEALGRAVTERLGGRPLTLIFEPGRAIAGDAGVLLTRVRYLKQNADKHFAVVDAAMNDLLRPALYSAWQDVVPVKRRSNGAQPFCYDIVGPVCESADFLASSRELALAPGDLLAIRSAGAYGFVMSSNYNSRPRAAEVMVDGEAAHLVRAREPSSTLYALESRLP